MNYLDPDNWSNDEDEPCDDCGSRLCDGSCDPCPLCGEFECECDTCPECQEPYDNCDCEQEPEVDDDFPMYLEYDDWKYDYSGDIDAWERE